MKAKELREKTVVERERLLGELSAKARELRFGITSRETKNVREYRKVKKTIARILTLSHDTETA
jgi:ribosomal protein L29